MLARLIGYFFTGLALILPIGGTIYLIYYIVVALDELFAFSYPGLGLLIVLAGVTFIGILASLFVGGPIFQAFERLLIRIPLLGYIYKAFKDLTQAFVGKENKFSEPVLVRISTAEVYKLGFITAKEVSRLGEDDPSSEDLVAVYLPLSYSLSGDLYLVKRSQLVPTSLGPKEAMQFIISGGVLERSSSSAIG